MNFNAVNNSHAIWVLLLQCLLYESGNGIWCFELKRVEGDRWRFVNNFCLSYYMKYFGYWSNRETVIQHTRDPGSWKGEEISQKIWDKSVENNKNWRFSDAPSPTVCLINTLSLSARCTSRLSEAGPARCILGLILCPFLFSNIWIIA